MVRVLRMRAAAVIAGISALAAVAWAYLAWMHLSMPVMPAMEQMVAPEMTPYDPLQVLSLFLMWAIMMAAMMLPGAVPAVLVFDRLAAMRRREGRGHAGTCWFVAGYLGAWVLFSAGATLAQWGLHAAAVLSAAMVLVHPLPGTALLTAAGVYQLTPLKRRCLVHCRTPLDFLMHHWREGRAGALMMGVRHGAWCVGCCWLLMGVLFVAGVMHLAWIVILTLLVVAEKTVPHGERLARVTGIALLGWAAWRIFG
jgi:predicted metal-binding membrane protein